VKEIGTAMMDLMMEVLMLGEVKNGFVLSYNRILL
jgi:hypothetical protein